MTARHVLGGSGVALIAVGLVLIVRTTRGLGIASWLAGAIVLNDAVVVPIALGMGWLMQRTLPAAARAPAVVALVTMAGLLLVGLPFAVAPTRDGQSGTLLTQPYGRNLILLGGALLTLTALAAFVRARRSRRRELVDD